MTDTTKTIETTGHSTEWVGADLPRKEDPALVRGLHRLRRRPAVPRDAARGGAALPARARPARRDRHHRGPRRCPGCTPCSPAPDSLEHIGPLARFCAEEVVEHAIAVEKVRYQGEAVVAVAAESRYVAEDALALIRVEYEPLPVLTNAEQAMAPGAALVHDNLGSNVVYQHAFTFGDVDADFAAARPGDPSGAALAAGHRGADGDQRRGGPVRSGRGPDGRVGQHQPAELRRLGHVRAPWAWPRTC